MSETHVAENSAPNTTFINTDAIDKGKAKRMTRKAALVRKELVATEASYNQGLLNMKTYYIDPLKSLKLVTPAQINILFYQISQLLKTSNMFLGDLIKVVDSEGDVGAVFQQWIPFFKPYKFYAINHEKASILLRQLQKRPEFVAFETRQQNIVNQNILGLIILPVQRPPRYKLLLKELIKQTPKNTTHLESLEVALKACSQLNHDVNEAIKESERRERVREVSRQIYGKEEQLMAPAREFIFQGELSKINRRGGSTSYTFFLFNDMLIYCKRISRKKWKMHQEIEINRRFNFSIPDSDVTPNSFVIKSPVKTFMAVAPNFAMWETWKKHLEKVIQSADVSLKSNKRLSFVKPLYMADSEANNCPLCEQAFTRLIRRHHCRSCGTLVCGNCSKERLKVDNFTESVLRVCTVCHQAAQAHFKYAAELKQSNGDLFAKMKLQQEKMGIAKTVYDFLVDREGKKLVQRPDSIFLYKGLLRKVCKNKNKLYCFYLFSDVLCYGEAKKEQTKIHCSLPINAVFDVQDIAYDRGYPPNSFCIYSCLKSFVVFASDVTSKIDWLLNLIQAKKDRIQSLKNSGLYTRYGKVAPIFTPDHFVHSCELCKKNFTLIKRRHHCQQCGILVCDSCSKLENFQAKTWEPNNKKDKQKVERLRVCDKCVKYFEIQKSLQLVMSIPFLDRSLTKETYWTKLKRGGKGVGSFFITCDNMDFTFTDYLLVIWPEEGTVYRQVHFKIYKEEGGQEVIHSMENDNIMARTWDSFFTLLGLDTSLGLKMTATLC